MSSPRPVYLVESVRTAIGTFGGSLKDTPPTQLAALAVRALIARSEANPDTVEHVVFGHVINTEPRDMYLARVAGVLGGLPIECPALTVNRLCGSGLQAIVSAAQLIEGGHANLTIAGGAEVMSRAPYSSSALRWGVRMQDSALVDMLAGALTDPFDKVHMGITAENIAEKWGISREEQDAFALQSQQRAAQAWAEGRFDSQIFPVNVRRGRDNIVFDRDEHLRADASIDDLSRLKPVFKKDGSVTAGNASGMNDGAAALLLASEEALDNSALKAKARLVGYAFAGVEPQYMGIGPVPAIRKLLSNTGVKLADIEVIELNEAFAAQAIAVMRDLDIAEERCNPNGSGISLGHPVGATGAMLATKALYELERISGRYALISMCIGGGQGIAMLIERIE